MVSRAQGQAAVGWTAYAPAGVRRSEARATALDPLHRHAGRAGRGALVEPAPRQRRGHVGASSVPPMARLVAAGLGRGMLPCFAGDVESGLHRLHPPVPEAGSALWLLIHANLRRNARVRAFVDFAFPALLRKLASLIGGKRRFAR